MGKKLKKNPRPAKERKRAKRERRESPLRAKLEKAARAWRRGEAPAIPFIDLTEEAEAAVPGGG